MNNQFEKQFDISYTEEVEKQYPEFQCMRPTKRMEQVKLEDWQIIKKTTKQRVIFRKMQLTDEEINNIAKLKEYISQQNIQLELECIENWTDINYLMFWQQYRDFKKCVQEMKDYVEFRKKPAIQNYMNLDSVHKRLLDEGVIYCYGRDKCHRPVVVMDIVKINAEQKKGLGDQIIWSCLYLYQGVLRSCFMPGVNENVTVILNSKGLQVFSIPVMFITKIVGTLNKYFLHMADTICLYEPPTIVRFSWGIIKQCFNEETNQRIRFCTLEDRFILDLIDGDQLEKRFGGNVELDKYWPPQNSYPLEQLVDRKGNEPKDVFKSLNSSQYQRQQSIQRQFDNDISNGTIYYSFSNETIHDFSCNNTRNKSKEWIKDDRVMMNQSDCRLFSCLQADDKQKRIRQNQKKEELTCNIF